MSNQNSSNKSSLITRLTGKVKSGVDYCTEGVWNDSRQNWKISTVKVLNLSVRSFLSADLQTKACSMTYRTLLAVVPALALVCAIGRGFGLQNIIMEEMIKHFPSQQTVLETAFGFVDSYLSQASGGIFVGVGVVFLLWSVISLIWSIESSFNDIWQVAKGRSIWRMATDYLAIILVLPILLICSNGLTIFMSTSLSKLLPYGFMQPTIEALFDGAGIVLTWLFFAATYMLIPNTKVKFRNAIVPGILVGSACQILQWLFLSGQLYVAKYNAIYGSFSFLPLFLIWMQLVWLFTLTGGVLCYAIQNINEYNYGDNIRNISISYRMKTTLAIMTIIAQRFKKSKPPMSLSQIANDYRLPLNLITPEVQKLRELGLVNFVENAGKDSADHLVQPAVDVSALTVGAVIDKLHDHGSDDFIPKFSENYSSVVSLCDEAFDSMDKAVSDKLLIEIPLNIHK